jgi:hypothetical protein
MVRSGKWTEAGMRLVSSSIRSDPSFYCLYLLTLFPTTKTFDLLKLKDKFHFITDALWHSVLRPSVSHGSSVWFPSSVSHVESLESIQYKMAKLIMNTRMNIPKSAKLQKQG